MQRGRSALGALDEIDCQAHDLVAVHFQFPDHELTREHIAAPAFAAEVQTGRGAARSVALGIEVLADLQVLADRSADVHAILVSSPA